MDNAEYKQGDLARAARLRSTLVTVTTGKMRIWVTEANAMTGGVYCAGCMLVPKKLCSFVKAHGKGQKVFLDKHWGQPRVNGSLPFTASKLSTPPRSTGCGNPVTSHSPRGSQQSHQKPHSDTLT
jgi:hypothetical protein